MPEAEQMTFKHKELTEILIRELKITSGHWAILFKFKLQAGNVVMDGGEVTPAAITFVESVGIQRVDGSFPLAVDAAKITQARAKAKAKASN